MADTDTYEKDLGQKSSLTTSDFIRVVGSDNVSYKQPVPSILASMGLSLYYTDTNSTSDGSTDDARYTASFRRVLTTFSNANPTVNRTYPIMVVTAGSSAGTFAGVVNVTSTAMRFFLSYANLNYSGQFLRGSNTINTIQRMPTRLEVQVLEKTVTGTTNVFGAINLNLPWRTNEIVSIVSANSNQWCIPMCIGASSWARVMTDSASFSVVANTAVELIVRYRPYTL